MNNNNDAAEEGKNAGRKLDRCVFKRWSCTVNALSIAQEVCESRGGRPGLSAPNKPHGFCGRKATLNQLKCLGQSSESV